MEAILPGGSIKQVFRQTCNQRIIVQGRVDRLIWTIENIGDLPTSPAQSALVDEFIDLRIPPEFDLGDVIIMEKFSKGRVVFKIPRNDVKPNYS